MGFLLFLAILAIIGLLIANSGQTQKLNAAQAQHTALAEQVKTLGVKEAQLAGMREVNARVHGDLRQRDTTIKRLQDAEKTASAKFQRLTDETARLKEQVSTHATTAKAATAEVKALQAQVEQLTTERSVQLAALQKDLLDPRPEARAAGNGLGDVQMRLGSLSPTAAEVTAFVHHVEQRRLALDPEGTHSELQGHLKELAELASHADLARGRLADELARLRSELQVLELNVVARDFGLYEPKYDFGAADGYRAALDDLRNRQKQMIKDGNAVRCDVAWTVGGSEATGRKMVKEVMQLMMFAFNGETEALISRVRFDTIVRIRERIEALYKRINILDGETGSYITEAYLATKLDELHLVHEYQEKRWREQEEQRQIREQMREEEKARRELEKAQLDAEREEQRYQQALERAQREIAQAEGAKQARLQEELGRLTALLAEAHERKERAVSQAQLTRTGHVYVISNVGSFGEDVYKIGMTRRLDPLDRVRELGDASVPFSFDVHAIIYTDDAPALETALHRAFDRRRLNQVNPRKEFFRVSLDEIRDVVLANHAEIEFTLVAEAREYRESAVKLAGSALPA